MAGYTKLQFLPKKFTMGTPSEVVFDIPILGRAVCLGELSSKFVGVQLYP